jgi:hypothetical protein
MKMLGYYGIAAIPGARDLQRAIPKPTKNYPPLLYALSIHYGATNLVKNPRNSIRATTSPSSYWSMITSSMPL